MKSFRTTFAIAVLASLLAVPTAQARDEMPTWLQVGTVLTWGVDYSGQTYDFIVTVKQLGPDLKFDYEMTAPASKKGDVTIKAKALVDADKLHNMFMGGPLVLEDKTTVWISQVFVKEYRGKEISHSLDFGSGGRIMLPPDNVDKVYKATLDGKPVEFPIHHLSYHGQETIWFHDNIAAPIIFKMDIGWKIWLKTIESPKPAPAPAKKEGK